MTPTKAKLVTCGAALAILCVNAVSCAPITHPNTTLPEIPVHAEAPVQKKQVIIYTPVADHLIKLPLETFEGELSVGDLPINKLPVKEIPISEPPVDDLPISELPVDEPPISIPIENIAHEDDACVIVFTDLSDYEANYDLLKRKVIQEAGNQGLEGMMAVAQVIYDRTYLSKHDWNQSSGLYGVLTQRNQFASAYRYDTTPFEPTIDEALAAVFVNGERVFNEITTYFYNPKTSTADGIAFMQQQKYVGTINDHEFRTGWDEND